MRSGIVPAGRDQRVGAKGALDQRPLHALTAAVDQADLTNTRGLRRGEVLDHHVHDITWLEAMQIELGLDWNHDRPIGIRGRHAS